MRLDDQDISQAYTKQNYQKNNDKNISKSKLTEILFKVNIKLDNVNQAKITVRKGDSLWSLTQKFAITQKLDSSKTNKVYDILQDMYNDYKKNE